MALFSVLFTACDFLILSDLTLKEYSPVYFKYSYRFSVKKITIRHFYSNFSVPAILSEEIKPMCVIHNISIATADDIMSFGDDVNTHPVLLSRAIIIWRCCI